MSRDTSPAINILKLHEDVAKFTRIQDELLEQKEQLNKKQKELTDLIYANGEKLKLASIDLEQYSYYHQTIAQAIYNTLTHLPQLPNLLKDVNV